MEFCIKFSDSIEDLHKAVQYIEFIEQYRKGKSTTEKTSSAPTQAELEELFERGKNT